MFDVVVIGAGPAGSAAAYHASRGGLRVLLVDRTPFPRPKACGDALSPRALAAIGRMGVASLPGHPVRGMRMSHEDSTEDRYEDFRDHCQPGSGLVIVRETLDRLLLEQALSTGTTFEVAHVERLTSRAARVSGVILQTPHGTREVSARTVIGATGSGGTFGLLGEIIPAERTAWGVAGRTYLKTSGSFGDDLEVYFPIVHGGRLLYGYGWLFPTGNMHVNVGVGVIRTTGTRTAPIRVLIEDFIQSRMLRDHRLAGALRCAPITTAPIAVGPLVEPVAGFLPVGDLAGLANPLTGEGIASAVESGELAASAVLAVGDDASGTYTRQLRSHVPRHFALRPALPAIYDGPALFLTRGWDVVRAPGCSPSSSLRRFIWDERPSGAWWGTLQLAEVREVVHAVHDDIVHATRRLRPFLSELVSCMLDEQATGFGWFAALGASVWLERRQQATQLPRATRNVLVTLEIVSLVTRLHSELLDRRSRQGSERVWGRNTLSLVLADCLTAHALRLLYRMSPSWGRTLGKSTARMLRCHAMARMNTDKASLARSYANLFRVTVRAGAMVGPRDPLPPDLGLVTDSLALLRTRQRGRVLDAVEETRDVLDRAALSPRPVTALLDTVIARCRRMNPPRVAVRRYAS